MNDKFDLISIGDATWDVFIVPSEAETFCEIQSEESMIAFKYGDKIPVNSVDYSVGGNGANNSVGVKRFGLRVAPILTLGDDSTSNQIVETFIKEGVDTSYVYRTKNTASNFSTIVVVGGERTIFSYNKDKEYSFPSEFPKTSWIYLTSMGDNFSEIYKKTIEVVKNNPKIKLAFNPGSRQVRAGVDKFLDVLSVCHVLYVNREEAETISGVKDTKGREKDLLSALNGLGPKISIVTDGPNGAFVFDGEKYYHSGVLPIDAYERTGAGDSFGAGCVAGLVKGKDIKEALLWGTVNSASVIGYVGAQRGLLKESEIPEWIERAKSSEVEVREI